MPLSVRPGKEHKEIAVFIESLGKLSDMFIYIIKIYIKCQTLIVFIFKQADEVIYFKG